ncbi:hypothetical protein ACF3MZ_24630 [Paenibacillaceae bacterium WGS1546]|uniref:DUF7689 domain-containing protein n=1 Tax=Cohnella sp. WGS1546 TaxID=3366810 RepID=UPI00372D04EB
MERMASGNGSATVSLLFFCLQKNKIKNINTKNRIKRFLLYHLACYLLRSQLQVVLHCLAYALGLTTTWLWPWKNSSNVEIYPTVSQVDTYMESIGYTKTSSSDAKVIAYGSTNSVVHFAKKSGSSTSIAKWGSLEVMSSSGLSPYNAAPGGYGPAVAYYK